MKKVIVFLILCAAVYGCWLHFSEPKSAVEPVETEAVADSLKISEKKELAEVQQNDSVPADSVEVKLQ